MYPLLLKIGPVPIYSYGLLIAIGFLVGIKIVQKQAMRVGKSPEVYVDAAFWALFSGFLGARILFIITRWSDYQNDLMGILRVWEGGFVFYGGLLLAVPVLGFYFRRHKIAIWPALDIMTPGLTVAHAFGRLGCFMAGCCYGRPTDVPWSVRLDSPLVDVHLRGIPLHPAQLYEAVAMFIVTIGLMLVFNRKKFDGQVVLVYLVAYPPIRSIVEEFRGDTIRGFVIDDVLSTSQFVSIFVFLLALGLLFYRLKQLRAGSSSRA